MKILKMFQHCVLHPVFGTRQWSSHDCYGKGSVSVCRFMKN